MIRRGRAVVAEGPVAFFDGRVYTLLQGDFKKILPSGVFLIYPSSIKPKAWVHFSYSQDCC